MAFREIQATQYKAYGLVYSVHCFTVAVYTARLISFPFPACRFSMRVRESQRDACSRVKTCAEIPCQRALKPQNRLACDKMKHVVVYTKKWQSKKQCWRPNMLQKKNCYIIRQQTRFPSLQFFAGNPQAGRFLTPGERCDEARPGLFGTFY